MPLDSRVSLCMSLDKLPGKKGLDSMEAMATKEAMGMEEAAREAGVSRSLLYRLVAEGKGPRTLKVAGRRLVRREALRKWLKKLEGRPSHER